MLVLTRKPGERVLIGDDIVVVVLDVHGDSIRLGFEAPRGVKIQREEVLQSVVAQNLAAARGIDEAAIVAALAGGAVAPQAPAPEPDPIDS